MEQARFTVSAKKVLEEAKQQARQLGYNYIGTEHVLLGILKEEDTLASKTLHSESVTRERVLEGIEQLVGRGDYKFTPAFGYSKCTKKIMETSHEQADNLGDDTVGTEHLLLAMLGEKDCAVPRILDGLGIDIGFIEKSVTINKGKGIERATVNVRRKSCIVDTPTIDEYSDDLTKAAFEGRLDPVIGREKEIERILQILSRRTKNNPVLVGDPGVGKSAIVEGLAQRVVKNRVPDILLDKRIVTLDLAAMVAGSKFRGEFEERLKKVISELKQDKSIILFIDEMHTIMGTGASEGSMDAANILKPALARGDIQIIGATTVEEYRKHIEKDAALERRFQPVRVEVPTQEETVAILSGLKSLYEDYHGIKVQPEAIKAAVELSGRYISDRFWPDKAIDLMDEALSKVRLRSYLRTRELMELKDELDNITNEKKLAILGQDYEDAASIRDREKELLEKITVAEAELAEKKKSDVMEVTEDDVAAIVAQWTSIPVTKLTEDDNKRLMKLEELMHKRVIGQDEAVVALARSIRRANAGLKDPKRPIGSFIFLGPTGVGKTELSKALTEALFSKEDAMIRIDMSEYMEKHSVSKLVGSPPGYIGYDEGGQLTEQVRRRPYSIILFDEIEKAHPDVFNILLQIMEDGRLTDSKGRLIDFKNTVLIMTSNVGAHNVEIQNIMGLSKNEEMSSEKFEMAKEMLMEELRKTFRPEFLNRVDEIVIFHPLSQKHTKLIADLMLSTMIKRLKEKGLDVEIMDSARSYLAKEGHDPMYGARPMRRVIQQKVEDALSEKIISGDIKIGESIYVYEEEGKIKFSKQKKE